MWYTYKCQGNQLKKKKLKKLHLGLYSNRKCDTIINVRDKTKIKYEVYKNDKTNF